MLLTENSIKSMFGFFFFKLIFEKYFREYIKYNFSVFKKMLLLFLFNIFYVDVFS